MLKRLRSRRPRMRVPKIPWTRPAIGIAMALAGAAIAWPGGGSAVADGPFRNDLLIARTDAAHHRKAAAVERIRSAETRHAQKALGSLATDSDDATALVAIGALGRDGADRSIDELRSIFEDRSRTDLVRSAAIGALLRVQRSDGADWSSLQVYVEAHTSTDDDVRDMARSVAKRLWGEEVRDA